MQRLTKEQAAIIGLYTGIACGPFQDIQELAEKVAGRPLWTHEFGNKALWEELKEKVKPQFLELCYDGQGDRQNRKNDPEYPAKKNEVYAVMYGKESNQQGG